MSRRLIAIVTAEVVLVLLGIYGYATAYSPGLPVSSSASQPVSLTGAGATLAYPLISVVKDKYQQSHPGLSINFQPVGSIAGLSLLLDETIDFAATYPPIPKNEWSKFPSLPLHIPESISAVVFAYNLPDLGSTPLQLNATVIANIYLGNIQYWDDPLITAVNGRMLSHHAIIPVAMAEAEGTTFVFSSYLSKYSDIKPGTTINWPSTSKVATAPGDADVAKQIRFTQYSIGYMELSYALETGLPYASVENSSQKFIIPSSGSASAALRILTNCCPRSDADWSSVNLLDSSDQDAYPLVTFTYLIVYQDLSVVRNMDLVSAQALAAFVWYLVHDGQSLGPPLGYVPLPANIVQVDEAGINLITFRGQHLLS